MIKLKLFLQSLIYLFGGIIFIFAIGFVFVYGLLLGIDQFGSLFPLYIMVAVIFLCIWYIIYNTLKEKMEIK
jgi:hypothetical protein